MLNHKIEVKTYKFIEDSLITFNRLFRSNTPPAISSDKFCTVMAKVMKLWKRFCLFCCRSCPFTHRWVSTFFARKVQKIISTHLNIVLWKRTKKQMNLEHSKQKFSSSFNQFCCLHWII